MTRSVSAAMLCLSLALLVAACQSTPAANVATPSAPSGTPSGSAVPAQLVGNWLLPADAAGAIAGSACPKPLTTATCMFMLTFTATTYNWTTNVSGYSGGGGDVVVNGSEMDFFNGQECGMRPPLGIGRYQWTLSATILHFSSLNSDPCPRSPWLINQSYSRAG